MDWLDVWAGLQAWFSRNEGVLTFMLSLTALIIALVSLRHSVRVPLLTEARVEHSKELRAGVPECLKLVPPAPPRDQATFALMARPLRRQLENNQAFRDLINYHRPAVLVDYETIQDGLARAEDEMVAAVHELAEKTAALIAVEVRLSKPPAQIVFDWNGEESLEEYEHAVDVFWPALVDLAVGEILDRSISRRLEGVEQPWWEQPYDWARHEWPWEGEDDEAYDLVWTASASKPVLAVVSSQQRRNVEQRLFGSPFLTKLRTLDSGGQQKALDAHRRFADARQQLLGAFGQVALIPVLPGAECPLITEAVRAVKRKTSG